MRVVIVYESLTGNTKRAAGLVADALYRRGMDSSIFPITGFNPQVVADADLVVLGTWTDGLVLIGQRPGRAKRFDSLPRLDGKRCAVFCTFAVNPGKSLDKLTRRVEGLGGEVLGGMTIRRDRLDSGAEELADRLTQLVDA